MTQIVTLENGTQHEFPDDASPDEINNSLMQEEHTQKMQGLRNALNVGPSNFLPNYLGGMLKGAQGLLSNMPDMRQMVPDNMKKVLPYGNDVSPALTVDPYKLMGTEDKPFDTKEGAEQVLGEMSLPGELIPKGIGAGKLLASKIAEKFSPASHANSILDSLGQGAKNAEENAKSLANDIRNAYQGRLSEATGFSDQVLNQVGDKQIYSHVDPLVSTAMDQGKAAIDKMKDLNVGDLYDTFKDNPTFKNAHHLQSELGAMIGQLEKNPIPTTAEGLEIASIKKARDSLKDNMFDFLGRQDKNSNENLTSKYQQFSDLYRDNVVPYLSSKKLRDITREGKTVVKNIQDIFDTPSDIVLRNGETKTGPINKIMQDLPDTTNGKILFNKIGGSANAGDMQKLAEKISDAENKGFSNYVTPDLKSQIAEGLNKSRNQNYLKGGAKWGGTALGITALEEILRHSLMQSMSSQNRYVGK